MRAEDSAAQALQAGSPPPRARTPDVVGTALLLFGHAGLVLLSWLMTFGIAMSTDVCAYVDCGDEKWVHYALVLIGPGSAIAFLVDIVVSMVLLVKQRTAYLVPLIGCIAQVALILVAFIMTSQAGPLS